MSEDRPDIDYAALQDELDALALEDPAVAAAGKKLDEVLDADPVMRFGRDYRKFLREEARKAWRGDPAD